MGSEYMVVDCPDGPRFILKKPSKAFAAQAPTLGVRVTASLGSLLHLQPKLDIDVQRKMQAVAGKFDEAYAKLQADYLAAYVAYATSPCDLEARKHLEDANAAIRRSEETLGKLEKAISELAKVSTPVVRAAPYTSVLASSVISGSSRSSLLAGVDTLAPPKRAGSETGSVRIQVPALARRTGVTRVKTLPSRMPSTVSLKDWHHAYRTELLAATVRSEFGEAVRKSRVDQSARRLKTLATEFEQVSRIPQ